MTLGKPTDKDVSLEMESADGYSAATVTVDRTSWLPKTMTVHGSVAPRVVALGDYRPELGLDLAHSIKATRASVTDTFTLDRAQEAPTFIRNPYAMLPWKPGDTTFDASKPAALETRSGPSGHILVHPLVNGKDVGWFILDTGAGWMVMDRQVADEMKLPSVGSIPTAGVGGIVTGHLRPTEEFTLGQGTMKGILFNDLDLSTLGLSFGTRIAGIVGYDLLRRVVMEIDLAGKKASLYDPAQYNLNGASWEPLGFVNRSPYVMAEFDKGLKGPFRLDTGAMASVIFHAPAVRKYHLLEGREVSTEQIGGVGGSSKVKVGTIASFTLGGKKFEKPSAIFTQAETGVMADRFLAGTVGHPLMEPFTLVFDYSSSRMAFLPHHAALR